jgi:hypothetical protein
MFNMGAITRGDVPPNVEAGIAIDMLQEAAVDQVAPQIQRLEESLAQAGYLMIALAKKFYIEPRLLKIRGAGGSVQVRKFLNSDIEGGFTFHPEAGSGLPRSRAGRMARINQLIEMQVLRPDQAWKHLDIADLKGIHMMFQADEDMAFREHDKLLHGEPLSQAAMVEAQGQIQQLAMAFQSGQLAGPDGQPVPEEMVMQEAQRILFEASIAPLPYENHQEHLGVHDLYLKSVEFEGLPPDVQQRFITHRMMTAQMLQQQMAQAAPKQPPRINLALKGTTSAPVAGELLRQSGINVTDEQVAEEPLETWVTDSVDKPDMDSAGNDPFTQGEQLLAMQQAEAKHDAEEARMQEKHDQALIHADEKHRAAMERSTADNDLARKRAEQSDFRPQRKAA